MTSSPDAARIDALPPALSSMWRLCKLGYRHEPALIVTAFALALLAAVPDALLALWFKMIGEGVLQSDWTRVRVGVLALGLSATATWFLATVSTRVQRRFRDKVTIALESHVATLLASISTIAHHERPDYLDRLSVLRNQVFMLDHMYMSLFSTCGWILRLGVTIALLVSIHPALALLVLCALPPVYTSTWRPAVERAAYQRGAEAGRLARHLFDVATTASPGKEVRVTGIADRLVTRAAAHVGVRECADCRGSMGVRRLARAGMGDLRRRVSWPPSCSSRRCSPPGAGDVLLALAAGSRLSFYVGATVGEIGFLRGIWMDSSRRLAWLEDYAASLVAAADRPSPSRLVRGIRFDGVSFAYPGTTRARARRRRSRAARGQGGRDCRRERRGQVDPGQAARQDVRAHPRSHRRRRRRSRRHCGRWTGAAGWPARSRTSSASSSRPVTRLESATCRAWTIGRRSRQPWAALVRMT